MYLHMLARGLGRWGWRGEEEELRAWKSNRKGEGGDHAQAAGQRGGWEWAAGVSPPWFGSPWGLQLKTCWNEHSWTPSPLLSLGPHRRGKSDPCDWYNRREPDILGPD